MRTLSATLHFEWSVYADLMENGGTSFVDASLKNPMPLFVDSSPPATIEVGPAGRGWRITSSDGLFMGIFRDRTSAVRCAEDEAEGHPGHIVIVREQEHA